jgi:hypothetical protein
MIFGESVFLVGLIQKYVKVDPSVRSNRAYQQRNNSRRFQRTLEAKPRKNTVRRCRVGLAGLWGPLLASSFECRLSTALGFASTPSFQVGLIRGLRIDATTYIYQPLPPSSGIKP